MTTRARRPTDETGTGVYSPGRPPAQPEPRRALFGASPGDRIASSSEAWEQDATQVDPARQAMVLESSTPTHVEAERQMPAMLAGEGPADGTISPLSIDRSEPIRVISMKNRAGTEPRAEAARVPLHVQLRSMAEVAGRRTPASGLGHLAPPRDAGQARRRRQRDNVVWACVAIVLACGISLGIWLVAGR